MQITGPELALLIRLPCSVRTPVAASLLNLRAQHAHGQTLHPLSVLARHDHRNRTLRIELQHQRRRVPTDRDHSRTSAGGIYVSRLTCVNFTLALRQVLESEFAALICEHEP